MEKKDGSQHIADRLAIGLNIKYNSEIDNICYKENKWVVSGEMFEKVIFCGNIKDMVKMIQGIDLNDFKVPVDALEYHGTTAVFCEIDKNPYSWIYLPSKDHESHRIICTGNFSKTNNSVAIPKNRITATIEFTDKMSKDAILDNLTRIPLHPKYIDHNFIQYTYPIQNANTRDMIMNLKMLLASNSFYFTGRFADWEYYNMDVAMGAALDMCKKFALL